MTPTVQIWGYRGLFLAICAIVITVKLLPLDVDGDSLPGPDLLLAITFAWLARHPAVVPLGLIVVVFLAADFLLQRPPGLWTALIVLATEVIRRRRMGMLDVSFVFEWTAFALTVVALMILYRIGHWLLVIDPPDFGLGFLHGLVTILVYPVVFAISHYMLRVPRIAAVEMEV